MQIHFSTGAQMQRATIVIGTVTRRLDSLDNFLLLRGRMQARAKFLACEAKEKLRSAQSGWRIEACRRREGLILGDRNLVCGLTQCAAVLLGQARLQLMLLDMAVRSA